MDALRDEVEQLEKSDNLTASIDDIQKAIDHLKNARRKVEADPQAAPITLAKLQTPVKQALDAAHDDLKKVNSRLNKYNKVLDKKFKDKVLPTAQNDTISSHPSLINRAIAMHLLREGQFGVASTFIQEAQAHPPQPIPTPGTPNPQLRESWESDLATGTFNSTELQANFSQMYHILHELRHSRNLAPAIQWARERSKILESRGSNLEFELHRLQFACLFIGLDTSSTSTPNIPDSSASGPLRAWAYARSEFSPFSHRYSREIQQLMGSLAYFQNIASSPYKKYFYNDSAWEEAANTFTREFCSLLGLSADSPLYIAVTAGAIALPTLLKVQNLMNQTRTEWTTSHELPTEVPLPDNYHFHSIFVCPVSKEQTTDENPPMMMPCGHVICKESLERLSKGGRFKCPYCPMESSAKEAVKVFL